MDLSKLPKLSDTKAAEAELTPPTDPATAIPVQPLPPTADYRRPATPPPPGLGVDVWISTIMGVLFVFMGMTFARFAMAKLGHQPFHTGVNWTTGPLDGQEVDYFDLQGHTAWTDMGAFLFGLTLLFEAATKAAVVLMPGKASRALLLFATLLTFGTVALNLVAAGLLMHDGILPLLSGIAVAFGGWILADEWQTLKSTARPSSAARSASVA